VALTRTAAAACAALVACGCAGTLQPADPEAARAAAAATTYSASVRVSLKGPDLRARTRALLAFQRPDALRVEIPGPTGVRLVAVAKGGRLSAVFPGDRAVYEDVATAASFESLLGVALTPEEVMDLLVGVRSPRLREYTASWGPRAPKDIRATLPDTAQLKISVEAPELGAPLPPAAFEPAPHAGYRRLTAEEARGLWSRR
jgi:hypothetical protein